MPTTPRKTRKLLESGKAKIYAHRPFTSQLLYGCRGYTQPITLGIDVGYQTVGYSAVTEKAAEAISNWSKGSVRNSSFNGTQWSKLE